jgi:hypothetical protein
MQEPFASLCGFDPANADAYDRAAATYYNDIGALLVRIDILLNTEITRAGATPDFITSRQKQIADTISRQVDQRIGANRGLWIAACRDLPDAAEKRTFEFEPLRRRYPDWMRIIDERH